MTSYEDMVIYYDGQKAKHGELLVIRHQDEERPLDGNGNVSPTPILLVFSYNEEFHHYCLIPINWDAAKALAPEKIAPVAKYLKEKRDAE